MKVFIEPIGRLINQFTKLPGVGTKTAQRYAYKVISMTESEAEEFANAILRVKKEVRYCNVCGNFSESEICDVCRVRDPRIICVVKEPKDVVAIEKSGRHEGVYHVLHGTINPMEGIGPNDIRIKELLSRLSDGKTQEVIIATNPTVEGEATAMYLTKLIKPLGIKVSRLAYGIPVGGELEYADEVTLMRAIEGRRIM